MCQFYELPGSSEARRSYINSMFRGIPGLRKTLELSRLFDAHGNSPKCKPRHEFGMGVGWHIALASKVRNLAKSRIPAFSSNIEIACKIREVAPERTNGIQNWCWRKRSEIRRHRILKIQDSQTLTMFTNLRISKGCNKWWTTSNMSDINTSPQTSRV